MARISSRAAGAAAAVIATAPLAAPAQGAGISRTVVADFTESYTFTVDCSQFGDYAFENIVEGEQDVRITIVTAADGTLLQTVTRSSFTETHTNSVSQASLPLAGTAQDVIDHEAGTRTVRGSIARGTQPGTGTYFQEAGQIVFGGAVGNPLFAPGRHDAVRSVVSTRRYVTRCQRRDRLARLRDLDAARRGQPIAWPMPRMLPSLSRNQAPRSPVPLLG